MTSSRTRPSLGPAAWLSALVIGVLLALAIPALAAGAEPTEGSTAVADPPAAQTQEPAETTGSTEPPAPEQTAAPADEPAPTTTGPAPPPGFQPAPELAPTPATEAPAPTPPVATPAPQPVPAPTPQPAPPPSSGPAPVTPAPPLIEELPLPVLPIAPPLAELLPVVAPLLPELTPALPTIPDVPRDRAAAVPVVPDVVSPATDAVDRSIALPVAPPANPRVADAVPTSVLGGPAKPVLVTPAGAADPSGPLADKTIESAGFYDPISLKRSNEIASAPSPRVQGTAAFGAPTQPGPSPFDMHLEAQGGPAPVGSSLLAVLASYVLPGSGSLPLQSTLFLFVQLAVILAFALAPRPGQGERLVLWGLLRSQAGHRLAVRRPG